MTAAPTPTFRLGRRYWLIAISVALAITVVETVQNTYRIPTAGWGALFLFELPVWGVWVALTPLIFRLAERFPITGGNWWRSLAVLVVAGLVLSPVTTMAVVPLRALIADITIANGIIRAPGAIAYMTTPAPTWALAIALMRIYFIFPLFVYAGLVASCQAAMYYRAYQSRLLRQAELETLLARSQLDALKFQLQPHFLFNTLHTISSLMTRDVATARRTVARLSDLLRYALRDSAVHEVTLAAELEFLRSYVEIQETRFGDQLRVTYEIDPETRRLLVPRMLLQPLVENAIKHGIPDGTTTAMIVVRSARVGDTLTLEIEDNGPGFAPNAELRDGIGLRNTRARLSQLYGSAQRLSLVSHRGRGVTATVVLPAQSEVDGDDEPLDADTLSALDDFDARSGSGEERDESPRAHGAGLAPRVRTTGEHRAQR